MGRFGTGLVVGVVVLMLIGCGSGKKAATNESDLGKEAQAACTGQPLSSAPKLPPSFPQIEKEKVTYTRQSTQGPTQVVEGYFNGDVKEAHDEYLKELKGAGYTILFDELEDRDSEISWKGEGRTGQVAMREECGKKDKTYIHITNRPA